MVRFDKVKLTYDNSGTLALDGVDLKVDEGEFVFLVGPSGSGKTSLMKLITGEVRADSGRVIVNDFDMMRIRRRKLPKMRRTLGVVFQDYRLIEKMNVYDNVAFAMRVVGASNREIRRRTRVVGTFPDGNSALMLVCARLRHVAGTQWGNKKYMCMKHLETLLDDASMAG